MIPVTERATPVRKPRLSKRKLRAIAWVAGVLGFSLPWAAFQAAPHPLASGAPQVVVVPAGSRVVVSKGSPGAASVRVVTAKGAPTTAPVATTAGSHVPV